MRADRFRELQEEFSTHELEIMRGKREHYANDANVLLNIEQIASMVKLCPEEVAYVLLMKHVQAIGNRIVTGNIAEDWTWVKEDGREGLKQHIADARNYLLLLAACLERAANQDLVLRRDSPGG